MEIYGVTAHIITIPGIHGMILGIHGDLPTMDGGAIMATIHGILHTISGLMRDMVTGIIIIITIIMITMPTGMLPTAGDHSGILTLLSIHPIILAVS